ncbi:MAG: DUF86 domain-containing protein [Chloroflexi bacterium]|nr:DUF86 domain-containing protein [Chloroflexota bacterium]
MNYSIFLDDVAINKIQSIHRCIARVREEYALAGDDFNTDFTRQDAAILNITRACEQAIDLANHTIRMGKMGIPQSSSESFELLARQKIISPEMTEKLIRMTGFRNTAVHQYQLLNLAVVEAVIVSGLDDLLAFCDAIIDYFKRPPADSGGE